MLPQNRSTMQENLHCFRTRCLQCNDNFMGATIMLSLRKRLKATQFTLAPIVDVIQCNNDFIGATIILQPY